MSGSSLEWEEGGKGPGGDCQGTLSALWRLLQAFKDLEGEGRTMLKELELSAEEKEALELARQTVEKIREDHRRGMPRMLLCLSVTRDDRVKEISSP